MNIRDLFPWWTVGVGMAGLLPFRPLFQHPLHIGLCEFTIDYEQGVGAGAPMWEEGAPIIIVLRDP